MKTLPWVLLVVVMTLLLVVSWRYLALRASMPERDKHARADALKRGHSVVSGNVAQWLAPILPWFPYNPRDARFLGMPVDFVVFDGLDEDDLREIVFVEVKTGARAALTTRERRVQQCVADHRIKFVRFDVPAASQRDERRAD